MQGDCRFNELDNQLIAFRPTSLYSPSEQIHAYGTALNIVKLAGPFTSFADYLTKAHQEPCTNCQYMFRNGVVTQYDVVSGQVDGPIPAGYILESGHAQRVSKFTDLVCVDGADDASDHYRQVMLAPTAMQEDKQ